MAHDPLNIWIHISDIHCYDEGDGWGNAEPYLWTVFFKIDGDTVQLSEESLKLVGSPAILQNLGNHGNLGTTDVDAGDDVTVPELIGSWRTTLKAIAVPERLKPLLGDDLPGFAGVVVILMEEDNVTDAGAEAGYRALVDGVRIALQHIIDTRDVVHQRPTPEEIKAFKDDIQSGIRQVIVDAMGFFERIWAWLNPDDEIGDEVWFWDQDELAKNLVIDFSKRWRNEGDWELSGRVIATIPCPANAIASMGRLDASMPDVDRSLSAMRQFRDRELPHQLGLQLWWNLALRNTPQLSYVLMKDAQLRQAAIAILLSAEDILQNRDKPLPDVAIHHLQSIFERLVQLPVRSTQVDASRVLDVLPQLQGKTLNQAFDRLSELQPARHPRDTSGKVIRKEGDKREAVRGGNLA